MTGEKLSQQKLESYLWGCAEYLRNKIDAGDYKVYIFPMLFYKRISDVYDEEYESLLAETNDEKYIAGCDWLAGSSVDCWSCLGTAVGSPVSAFCF